MIYPAADKLDAMSSKYGLVIIAAKRAKQLKEGARKYINTRSTNSLTIALEEIADSQIVPLMVGEPEKMPTSMAPSAVLTGLVSTGLDDDDRLMDTTASGISALLAGDDDDDDLSMEDEVLQASGISIIDTNFGDSMDSSSYGVDLNSDLSDDVETDADEVMEDEEVENEDD